MKFKSVCSFIPFFFIDKQHRIAKPKYRILTHLKYSTRSLCNRRLNMTSTRVKPAVKSQQPANPTSSTPSAAQVGPVLRFSRYLRNIQFSPVTYIAYHPNTVYCTLFGAFCVYWNYKLFKHNKGLYPDYDAIAADPTRAGTLITAKQQEMAAVQRYNGLVDDMRNDLKQQKNPTTA